MPQMAPIGWLSMFIIFSISFMIFNMMNYFLFIPSNPKLTLLSKKMKKTLLWKW
uniref:ATP synthase complex subunit 8 n=1 Tax=Senometopia prima TaxID=3234324 RepID=A0AB39A5Y2_9MUSC